MPERRRRSFTRDFKLAALKQMAETDNIHRLAEELGIERKLLYMWRDAFAACGEAGLRRAGRPSALDRAADASIAASPEPSQLLDPSRRIAELERKIGEQQLALDFFRGALRHVRERRRKTGGSGETASTP